MSDFQSHSNPEIKEWIQRRVAAVRENYTAYQALIEKGVELPDDSTPFQVSCPFHGQDNRPSARYYPREGGKHDYLRCFKCRENWDCINLLAKFNGLRFMDALADLERRYHIKIPKKPDAPEIVEPTDRSSTYVSDQWQDVPRMLKLLEGKLARLKPKCSFTDFVKFCRVLDVVEWDFNKINKSLPAMSDILKKLLARMDEVMQLPDDLSFSDTESFE
jgi:hypothetical protein